MGWKSGESGVKGLAGKEVWVLQCQLFKRGRDEYCWDFGVLTLLVPQLVRANKVNPCHGSGVEVVEWSVEWGKVVSRVGGKTVERDEQIYNRRTKKIMETMNVSFDELSAMAFEQRSSKPGLQSMTSGQISSRLDLAYAPSTITTQQPTEDTAPTPTNLSSIATIIPITSQDVDELNPNAMVDGNTFINPFENSSTSAAESSSSQNVDPLNMHTFYQPYPHEFQWTKDHPLKQVIGEPS
nr:hypothetical protein [Tanacetum cinerariifolium]